ncbi:MAG: putative LINOLEOYL-CoA [Myxococcaceae bacterium]|nr:putative LINOLEOYL-CoA [Myxococcaceae bacterium]
MQTNAPVASRPNGKAVRAPKAVPSQVRVDAETRPSTLRAGSPDAANDPRIVAFGLALDALRREVEAKVGEEDAQYIKRIGKLSSTLELVGRSLIHVSIDPVTFGFGVGALWVHKALELMEIGHPALHGCFDGLPDAAKFASETFKWKAPVDETAWKASHNLKHHQFTNIEGKDPDLNFGQLRLSANVPYQLAHALQPLSNIITGFGFGMALNLHVTGMLDLYFKFGEEIEVLPDKKPETIRAAHRAFLSKHLRHYGKEYVLFPLLAGPFFLKVLAGNLISEVARDLFAAAIIYCGHVGSDDYARGTEAKNRGQWYAMQVEGSRDVEVPKWVSILTGGLDHQIEHHLFPRMPPNRLREIKPQVQALCAEHGVNYRIDSWGGTLKSVLKELRRIAFKDAVAA